MNTDEKLEAIPVNFINEYMQNIQKHYPNDSQEIIKFRLATLTDLWTNFVFSSFGMKGKIGDNYIV